MELDEKEINHLRDLVLTEILNGRDVNINSSILRKLDDKVES